MECPRVAVLRQRRIDALQVADRRLGELCCVAGVHAAPSRFDTGKVLAALVMFLLDGHVRRVMRSHLRQELTAQDFTFEDHIGLTREIGELFGIEPKQGETLDAYVRAVREALGVTATSRGGGGYGVRR